MEVYLDNSATTKPYGAVVKEIMRYMEEDYGNPSSLHRMGITAEKALKEARRTVALSLEAMEEEIYFTSGGTESDNTAIFGAAMARKRRGNKIITSQIEHPAVLESCRKLEDMGFQVEYIGVDSDGVIKIKELEQAIDDRTILITVMQVNNEVGTVQPIHEIGLIKKNFDQNKGSDILFHTDAVQSYGKIPIRLKNSPIDLLSVSGHKIHGPKGIGALYVRKGIHISPYLFGGGQERSMRSGTENLPGIAGFGKAVELSSKNFQQRISNMNRIKSYLREGIQSEIQDIRINSREDGVPSILNVSFLGVRGEVLLHSLEQAGIYVSTGSACSSHKKGQSYVLKAMGLSEKEIQGAIRFSFSEFHTMEEMDYVLINLKNAVSKFRKLGSFR
ncbi:cysteine desulfurase family protein [Sinanaerobacter chloroacetimidivorans]|jgi:cysteine desulfurase|uniref:Cysteine desulfurase n=1 Tax=Sinanaerobacter chloroacetimidivorans TaxID=2818044 RepID=A0A8J7W249_9FIRM|nr:cysteine desulfurase family protein [Sinanaerobacter chloroacetimidivorans]MBR0599502.1 cysteine desulfurase [Sinanaerobacter chloroacetimidivorans]